MENEETQELKQEAPALYKEASSESIADTDSVKLTASADIRSDFAEDESSAGAGDSAEQNEDPLIGTTIGKRYKIVSLIGHGTTTSVYKAQDTKVDRSVALKILHTHYLANEQTARRFEQESKTLGLLKHHNIVSLYGSGVAASKQPYLVMEYAEGTSLKDLLTQKGSIERHRAVQIFIQVCAALTAAHAAGIVHRDLKPANIMVSTDSDGRDLVKMLDFGVAKLLPIQGETFQTKTQTGEMLGTLAYMSPEQCLDQDVGEQSDIYSLGCVMYEMLTGTIPLCGRTAFETMNKHLTEMPKHFATIRPDLHLPVGLEAIVWKAMAKDLNKRYISVGDLEDDLNAFVEDRLPPARLEEVRQEPPRHEAIYVAPRLESNKPDPAKPNANEQAARLEEARMRYYRSIAEENRKLTRKYRQQWREPNTAVLESERYVPVKTAKDQAAETKRDDAMAYLAIFGLVWFPGAIVVLLAVASGAGPIGCMAIFAVGVLAFIGVKLLIDSSRIGKLR